RARQVGRKGNVRAGPGAGKVAREPERDRLRVDRPSDSLPGAVRMESQLDMAPVRRVDDANPLVRPGGGRHAKTPLGGAEKTSPAGVIGVFAEHLDASRDKEAAGRGRVGVSQRLQRSAGLVEQLRFPLGLERRQPGFAQPFGKVARAQGSTAKPRRRSETLEMSPRVERSSTLSSDVITRKRACPRPIASSTARGSSSSPRTESGTSRQASKISLEKRQQFMLTSADAASRTAASSGFSKIDCR